MVHIWTDEYDWTLGKTTLLPSADDPLRFVSHSLMLALRDAGGAADFLVRPMQNWAQNVTGTLTIRDGKVVEAELSWGELELVPRNDAAEQQ